jgi:hypothetical protein
LWFHDGGAVAVASGCRVGSGNFSPLRTHGQFKTRIGRGYNCDGNDKNRAMTFANSVEAKEFLVSRIVEEARREQVSLSELETKMLYFSEHYPTLPDMAEINEKFDAKYDSEKYEKKIRRLTKKAFKHDREESTEYVARWHEAVRVLKKEDHYLLVMLDVPRSAGDVIKLFIAGVVVAALGIAAMLAFNWARAKIRFRIPDNVMIVACLAAFAVAYCLAFTSAGTKLGDWAFKWFERVGKRIAKSFGS